MPRVSTPICYRQVSTGDAATANNAASSQLRAAWKPSNDQEWTNGPLSAEMDKDPEASSDLENVALEHRVRISFKTDIFGTFRQSVVFDFGTEPVLVKHLCVDVVPVSDADKMKEIRKVCLFYPCRTCEILLDFLGSCFVEWRAMVCSKRRNSAVYIDNDSGYFLFRSQPGRRKTIAG